MISQAPTQNIFNIIPETFKRLLRFAKNPSKDLNESPDANLGHITQDYIASFTIVTATIAAFDAFIPGYLEINPLNMLRMGVFLLILTLNAILFSSFLWLFSTIAMLFRGLKSQKSIFYQGIKAFAFLNIPSSIIIVIVLNRIVVSGDIEIPASISDKYFSTVVAIGAFVLAAWLIAIPLGKRLRSRYHAVAAYPLGFVICILASIANPIIASGYFSNVLNKENFCEQFISFRKKAEIRNGALNKDAWIGKCMTSLEGNPSNKAI
jgi:hypothetical protein